MKVYILNNIVYVWLYGDKINLKKKQVKYKIIYV